MSAIAEAPKASSSQPEWTRPTPQTKEPVLEVYNSMTRKKEVFTPVNGRRVDWYNCGPTVYDSSHMGHARYVCSLKVKLRRGLMSRNYLTQDIIRRILQNYFGYDVNFVMNITDIDDKVYQTSDTRADDRSSSEQENRTSSNKLLNRTNTLLPNLWKQQKKHSRNT